MEYPGVGHVDAVIDIVKGKYDIPQDSGVPTGDVFVYSDYNQSGTTVIENTKKSPNIDIGDGTMLQSILKDNGDIVKNGFDSVKQELVKNTQEHINKMLSYEKTFDTAIGKINTSISTSGISLSNAIKSQADKQSGTNSILESILNTNKEVGKKQIQYHDERLEEIEFNKKGDGTKDSLGNDIVPRKAKAIKDAELGIEESRMNNFSHGDLLNSLGSESDSLIDKIPNLFKEVQDFYTNVSYDDLDNIIKNDKEF
ncbi:hypothetical protein CRV02_08355 [Arcobacter sp. CECT 8989]|uniref:hypothetical protein n=1 Tax=Arcobacter sp. CECT 8989 TaxID=2044509 RepID=UPI00100B3D54|nr:hypothetical protein [Arcobacter sp. CECT 8989]RXK01511.1 hypothetical protein CRV02_08355 [Arcobacter sp. CECT 8989]